jgi:DtxR family Mn-dependent transcriptional regulator
MVDPAFALLVAATLVAVVCVLIWPVDGLLWRLRRSLLRTKRVLIEDALKHLHDCEYRGRTATVESLAGALRLSGNRTADLLGRLEALGLLRPHEDGFQLTADGRSHALRVIRIHRLWERYLADRTGATEADWHRQAEEREHTMSPDEAEALAARLGHPRYDPHGDAIPTASGDIPPAKGQPMTALTQGQVGRIVHVEDEPETLYAQLVADGLNPGMHVRIMDSNSERIRFEVEGEEIVLAPVVAANVWVVPLAAAEAPEGPFHRLSDLRQGEQATVEGISRACRGPQRRRLMDLGLVPGTVVEAELVSSGGDPIAYRIRGGLIALRRAQAELVHVQQRANEVA